MPIVAIDIIWFNLNLILYDYITVPLAAGSLYLCVFCFCIRAWLLYFDTNLTKHNLEKVWKSALDPTVHDNNWFTNNQQKLGSPNFLLKFIISITFLVFGLGILWRNILFVPWIDRVQIWTIFSATFITSSCIWYKLRLFYNDSLGIRDEMVVFFRGYLILVSLGTIINGLFFFQIINELYFIVLIHIVQDFAAKFTMIALTWVPRKLTSQDTVGVSRILFGSRASSKNNVTILDYLFCVCFCCLNRSRRDGINSIEQLKAMSPITVSASSQNTSDGGGGGSSTSSKVFAFENVKTKFYWTDIVCTDYGYESLMNHLTTEFSIENLLFISEVKLIILCFVSCFFILVSLLFFGFRRCVVVFFVFVPCFSLFLLLEIVQQSKIKKKWNNKNRSTRQKYGVVVSKTSVFFVCYMLYVVNILC